MVSTFVRYLPGVVAAMAAFGVLKLTAFFGITSLAYEMLAFLAAYLILAVLVDKAMVRYGRSGR